MARNVEIKARVAELAALEARVAQIADRGPFAIEQDDRFYRCDGARLKLRVLAPDRGQLIRYRRPDQAGPKLSDYEIAETSTPAQLAAILDATLPAAGRVRKRRTLYLAGATRIHLDRVEGLGDFLDLEVVLVERQAEAEGVAVAEALLDRLGVDRTQSIEGAYVDLLAKHGAGAR
ncbi:MAG: class IV adenylate cyclase [Betaproteobacteria bacterium]